MSLTRPDAAASYALFSKIFFENAAQDSFSVRIASTHSAMQHISRPCLAKGAPLKASSPDAASAAQARQGQARVTTATAAHVCHHHHDQQRHDLTTGRPRSSDAPANTPSNTPMNMPLEPTREHTPGHTVENAFEQTRESTNPGPMPLTLTDLRPRPRWTGRRL